MFELSANDLVVHYGQRVVLKNANFTAEAGKITVIAGPNGSGKSTLVRALCGEIRYRGNVKINGSDIADLAAWQLAGMRAVLPQETKVSFPFTVGEIIRLGLKAGGHAAQTNEIAEAALAKVGLQGFSQRLLPELSGGERQRVQLARVLCQIWEPVGDLGPRWLIMDEPVASLDVHHQISLMELARDYAARGGGVIAVMHDLNLSALYAEKIVLMNDGVIAASGDPRSVFTAGTLCDVFNCPLQPNYSPRKGTFILPHSAVDISTNLAIAAE